MAVAGLETHLDRLITYFRQMFESASWQDVLIVESAMVTYDSGYQIPRTAFFTLNQYSERFTWLLAQGYSWINLNAAGVFDGTLLVIVELPKCKGNVPIERVAINFSGPFLTRGKECWDISQSVKITD